MQIVVKLHSRCNINCSYCYMYNKGDNSYLNKPKSLPRSIILKIPEMVNSYLDDYEDEVSLCFHGGEPLLFGAEDFEAMLRYLSSTIYPDRVKFSVQTNAMLVDQRWISIFERFGISVSASLDGPRNTNDISRNHIDGRSSYSDAERGIELLRDSNVNFAGVICVAQSGGNGREVVSHFNDYLKLDWFDILLPDFTHDDLPSTSWEVEQEALTRYMIDAFDAWFERLPNVSSCRFFESIVARGLGRRSIVDTIGKDGVQTVVLETNGYLEPHDVARICTGMSRETNISVGRNAIQRLFTHENYQKFLEMDRSPAEECVACEVFEVCRGGHLFHRYSRERVFKNPSVHCKVLSALIQHINRVVADQIEVANSHFADKRTHVGTISHGNQN